MKTKYQAYQGPQDFIFIRADKDDESLLNEMINKLIENEIRVFYDMSSSKDSHRQEEIASAILNSNLCVFVLSKEAVDSLDLRNSINYALSLKKDVVCIRKDDCELSYGLDMQLSNIPFYKDVDKLVDYIKHNYESCVGEGQIPLIVDQKRKKMTIVMACLASLLLIGGIVFITNRINYFNSAEYRLKDIDNVEYLDFTSFKQEDIKYLENKTIDEISFKDMNINTIEDIDKVNVKIIDISGNPNLKNVLPIIRSNTLETIMISQDMIKIVDTLFNADIEVVVTR